MLRRLILGSATLAAALYLALPSSATAFSKGIWGTPYVNGVNQFRLYHQLGVSIDQIYLYWNDVAPTRPRNPGNPADPAYQWPAAVDQAIALARPYHMRIMLEVLFTPPWANGNRGPNWVPAHVRDYATFLKAAARRYPTVHLWQIWGEPNRNGNFMPEWPVRPGFRVNRIQRIAPHNYARLLDAAYGALKSVSKSNLVIGGSTFTDGDLDPHQWIANLWLQNNKAPRMDMYAHNPFSWTPPSFSAPLSPGGAVQFSDLPYMAKWVDHYLHKGMPLYLSEFTIPTAQNQVWDWWVDPGVAAQWVKSALWLCRHWKRIYALSWIYVYDQPPSTYSGLLDASGNPKPDFYAFEHG